jgi:T/G mismatch-specific endonuclease (EC 3.1.-.-)
MFWHRHEGCPQCYTPKSRQEFWQKKFNANIARDKEVSEQLKAIGWHQLVLWECEIKEKEALTEKSKAFFDKIGQVGVKTTNKRKLQK